MADQFVAEIRILPFNFTPKGWAFCNGQLLPISQNTALFSLLGTTYGGDGKSTFALPNLQGAAPMHPGQGPGLSYYSLGESSGTTTVSVLESEIPSHFHGYLASGSDSNSPSPEGQKLASAVGLGDFSTGTPTTPLDVNALQPNGGNLPHNNMMPYLALGFHIALQGIFPPRG